MPLNPTDVAGNPHRCQPCRLLQGSLVGRATKLVGGVGDHTIAEWVFDTVKPGMLTESRSYVDGNTAHPYIQRVRGYDAYARPTGTHTIIPTTQGGLAGTYTTHTTYTPTGQIATHTLPAMGGLPAETLTHTYNTHGLPTGLAGANHYINSTIYNPFGMPSQWTGRENNTLVGSYTYNPETLHLDRTSLHGQTTRPQIVQDSYLRNQAGQIIRTSSEMNFNQPAAVRTMCYRYDTRARLDTAWTSTDNCTANPTSTNNTTGGVVPIWYQWSHNDAGVRTTQTRHKVNQLPAPTHTTTYTLGLPGHAHATKTETTTATGSPATTTNYAYDPAGNTTTATTATTTETLTWNPHNQLLSTTKAGNTTSYIRDADGQILLRKDPTGTTLYTPAGQLRLTGTTTTGTRTYTHNNQPIAQRTGTTLQALYTDHTGTGTLAINWTNLTNTTWRFHDPYGNHLNGIGTWSTDHTYLNLPTDPTTGY